MKKITYIFKYDELEIERAILELQRAILKLQSVEFVDPQIVDLMRKEIVRLKKLPSKKCERL